MAFHTYKIEKFGKTTDGSYSDEATLVDNIVSASVNLAAGENADGFSFTQFNDGGNDFEDLAIDDRVKIYGSLDGTTFTLLIDGMVNQKQQSGDTNGDFITITGLNRLEKLFNALVSTTGESVQHTASYWVKNLIDQVNEFNKLGGTNREIKYNSTTIVDTTDTISFVKGFERAFKLIEELSKPEYTGGLNYVYYMDNNNYFYFTPRSDVEAGVLTYGDSVISHRTTKGMFDIVNYIIMNAGKSPYGMSILQFDYNADSIRKFGWKVKLVNEGISSAMGTDEIRLMRMRNVYAEDSLFPNAYDYTTSWGTTTSSDSEYNSDYVDEALVRAKDRIRILLNKNGGASYKVNLVMMPSFGYGLYNTHTLIIPANGKNTYYNWDYGVKLRIETVHYSFSEQGWKTDLGMKQDSDKSEGGSI